LATTIEKITEGYEYDRQHRNPPITADDLPFAFEDITPEWLTAVLCAKHSGAKVVSSRLDTADDGTSNRRRIFIEYNAAGTSAGLPKAVFCKASHTLANRISLGISGGMRSEVNFYNVVRPLLDIETPVCFFARYTPTFNSLVMLEDISDSATFCTHTTDWTRERAESQMRLMANFHGKFLGSPELATSLSVFPTWTEYFGGFDIPDVQNACDIGFGMAEEVIPPRLFARRQEIWTATRRSVERHKHIDQTLMHGDVHLRNWYLAANGEAGLTDWQGASRGHWSRDFIFALVTSLTIEHRREWQDELLSYYLDQLAHAAGRPVNTAGASDEIRRQLFTVLAYWTMTINPPPGLPDMQPRDSTLEFLRRMSTAIDDLDALDSFN
jgi:hypothetical protein